MRTKLIFLGILSIFSAVLISFFISTDALAYKTSGSYTTSEINSFLYGGVSVAYSWDQSCKDRLEYRRSVGDAPRTAVNNAPSYIPYTWVSGRNEASRTAPVEVDYGTTRVPMQLNSIMFLCAALVQPNKGADFARTYGNGLITSASDANDRAVGTSTVNSPAMTNSGWRINSINISSGGGRVEGLSVNTIYTTPRNNSSRYWFARPINFDYVTSSSSGITSNTTITITLNVTNINTFQSSNHRCADGTPGNPGSPNVVSSYNRCTGWDASMSISLSLRQKYTLTPGMTINGQTGSTSVEPGSLAQIESTVRQGAGDTSTAATDWRVTKYVYRPGSSLSNSDMAAKPNNSQQPCAAFSSSSRQSCEEYWRQPNRIFNGRGDSSNHNYNIEDLPVGTRVCFVTSVSRPTQQASPLWSHSSMACLIIAKKPKVQIIGGDLSVGGAGLSSSAVSTSISINSTGRYGSYGEYGVAASGRITGMASASGFAGGSNTSNICSLSNLTFNNATTACSDAAIGNYTSLQNSAAGIASRFPTRGAAYLVSGNVNLGGIANGVYGPRDNGLITLSAANIQPGRWVVINTPNNVVRIAGNINYSTNPMSSASDIPQVIIIARNILIDESVSSVDSWLVAKSSGYGIINTCSAADLDGANAAQLGTLLNANRCSNKLTVNGPVMANRLLLRRTAGAGPREQSGQPAEVFNLRPDAYLWLIQQSRANPSAPTTFTKELPPKY